jgi:hypothetical protein
MMASREEDVPSLLIVPRGTRPLPDKFIEYLWDYEVSAFLVKNDWMSEQESGQTGLGLRVAPGSA